MFVSATNIVYNERISNERMARKDNTLMNKRLRNALLIGAVTLGAMACANKAISVLADRRDDLPVGKGRYFRWRHGNIYYTKTGQGSPLLLVHDLDASSSSYEWSKVIPKLAQTHTVYALDLLGCGRSDKPNLTYTNFLYVQLLNDFIRSVVRQKTSVAATGESFSFVVMACNMDPGLYDRLIGVSPCELEHTAETPSTIGRALKYLIDSPIVGTFLYNLDTCRYRIADKADQEYFYKKDVVSEDVINAYYKGAKTEGGRGKYLSASIRSDYTNIDIVPALRKTKNEMCLIGGRVRPWITKIIGEYQACNPAIQSGYVSGTNYLPQLEAPDAFAELMSAMLE